MYGALNMIYSVTHSNCLVTIIVTYQVVFDPNFNLELQLRVNLQSWTSTGSFSNSMGSSLTNGRFFLFIDAKHGSQSILTIFKQIGLGKCARFEYANLCYGNSSLTGTHWMATQSNIQTYANKSWSSPSLYFIPHIKYTQCRDTLSWQRPNYDSYNITTKWLAVNLKLPIISYGRF